jgi:DNA polymerase-3 subunit delta'
MSFGDIVGHEKQLVQLQNSLRQGRMPHALLFHGPEGVGKKAVAFTLAKAMNCLVEQPDSCDLCSSCRKADHKNHLDIIVIAPEGQFIKIQAVRDLQERLKFKPREGKHRVCIIDDAERMNDAAANALLKTLEEPPPGNLIILVTARPFQLPPTILSRCRQLRFNPLIEEKEADFLQKRLGIDDAAARLLAVSSGGSIARAIEMHGGAYLEMREDILDWATARQGQEPLQRLAGMNRFGQSREEAMERLNLLRICYRDALVAKELPLGDMLINQDRREAIASLAERLTTKALLRDLRTIERARRALEQNADKTLTLEVMMLRLS